MRRTAAAMKPTAQRRRLGGSLGILVAFLLLGPGVLQAQQVASLSGYRGSVDVVRAGRDLSIHPGMGLQTGDIVVTRRGVATVVFSDSSQIRIRPDSRVSITHAPGRRDIEVFLGKLWFFVVSQKEQVTQFRTGTTITAVRGTSGEIFNAGSDGYYIGCLSGQLVITIPGQAESITLNPGQGIHILQDGSYAPHPFSEGAFAGQEGGFTFDSGSEPFWKKKTLWLTLGGGGALAAIGLTAGSDETTMSP